MFNGTKDIEDKIRRLYKGSGNGKDHIYDNGTNGSL